MSESPTPVADKRYVKGDLTQRPDYGWRLQGRTVLLHEDHSLACDGSAFEMEAVLRQMSLAFASLDNCLQCGMCTGRCPNTRVSGEARRSPRELIQMLRLGLLDLSGPELWFCTNCGGCTRDCPSEVPLIDVIVGLRNLVFTEGAGYLPQTVKGAAASVKAFNNPWMEPPEKRSEWLAETGFETSPDHAALLLFVCCSPSYDRRNRGMARAAAQLLDRMGLAFDTLGDKEVCCGDGVMRVGDFDTFARLKEVNRSHMEARGLRNVYTLSPHCFHTMKTDYFDGDDAPFSVRPFPLLLHKALQDGSLVFSRAIHRTVTYHDPCFLAKHHGICEEPRELLESIEGLSLVEMAHSRGEGLCCGGGGGGLWLDRKKGERLGEVRLDEALASGAEVVVTACPHCLSMLEDAAKSSPKYEHLRIMDLCELALEAL